MCARFDPSRLIKVLYIINDISAETRYSTFDKELLAMYLAIQHFRHLLEGGRFHVFTDYKFKPMTYPLHIRSQLSPSHISQFTSRIRHVLLCCQDNAVTDAMHSRESRPVR
jgi:hypothetical protein